MADLAEATRELFDRSLKAEVFMRTPFLEELQRRRQITYKGGTSIKRLVDTGEMDDLGQAYKANEPLTDQKKDMLAKPEFTWKYYQMPLKYDVDEYTQNITAGREEQLLNLADFLVKKGQRGIRLALQRMMFNANPETRTGSETGVADGSEFFQSLLSALGHDITYGTLSRSLLNGTNNYWQGANPSFAPTATAEGSSPGTSTQNTAYDLSINNLRKWLVYVEQYVESLGDLYVMMCPTLYNKMRAEMESKMVYDPAKGDTARQGFQKMYLDGNIQIVKVPYLETGWGGSGTTENWVFILNLPDWELRIHQKRNFNMTPFVWQGQQANGFDYWLARIMLCGNLICWKPNGSMWLRNVS